MKRVGRFLSHRQGATGVLIALLLPALVGFAALGMDYGSFVYHRNRLQDAADLAALEAAGDLRAAIATAERSLQRNGFSGLALTVTRGRLSVDERDAKSFQPDAAGDAVLLEASQTTPRFFSGLFLREDPVIRVRALAITQPIVAASAGSALMNVSGGLPAAVTRALIGSEINLSLLSYRGLYDRRISASGLIDTLARSIGMAGATVGEVLDKPVSKQIVLQAVSAQMRSDGNMAEASYVSNLLSAPMLGQAKISLKDVLQVPADVRTLRVGAPSDYLTARLDALGLITATLAPTANGSALAFDFGLPGLASAKLDVLIGEPMLSTPPLRVGNVGLFLSTAQVRARFHLKTEVSLPIFKFKIDLPVEVAIAPAEVRVLSTNCDTSAGDRRVLVEATPGAIRIEIGKQSGELRTVGLVPSNQAETIADVSMSAPSTNLLAGHPSFRTSSRSGKAAETSFARINAHGLFTIQTGAPRQAWFSDADMENSTIKTIGSLKMIGKMVNDLLSTLTIDPQIVNASFGIGTQTLAQATQTALSPITPTLDTLLDGFLGVMGIHIGAVDVRIDDLVCTAPRIAA